MARLSIDALKKFTKEELIYYLKTIEFYIPDRKTESIEYCILNKRHDDVSEQLDKILSMISKFLKEYEETQNIDKLIEVKNLTKERERLWKKQQKIKKELWEN